MEAMLESMSADAEPVGIESSQPSPREGPDSGAGCLATEETVLAGPPVIAPVGPVADGSNSEEEDEGLPILARKTKVLVRGNARTRKALLGKTGVVEKATGLGGWHWLVGCCCCCCYRAGPVPKGASSCAPSSSAGPTVDVVLVRDFLMSYTASA